MQEEIKYSKMLEGGYSNVKLTDDGLGLESMQEVNGFLISAILYIENQIIKTAGSYEAVQYWRGQLRAIKAVMAGIEKIKDEAAKGHGKPGGLY